MLEDRASRGDSPIHRLDPRARVVLALAFTLLMAFCQSHATALAGCALALGWLLLSRPSPRALLPRLAAAEAFVLFLVIFTPFSLAGEPVFSVGPLTATRQGLELAGLLGLKATAAILALAALLATIPAPLLGRALQGLGAPRRLCLLLVFAATQIHALAREFERLRTAGVEDISGILAMIAPLEADGHLVRRTRERLETEIGDFTVVEREGTVVACAALHPIPDTDAAEVACLVVHPDYRGGHRGRQLLRRLEDDARAAGRERLFVLTTRTAHWFQEQGFAPASVDALPASRQAFYNLSRSSRVLIKPIG